MIEGQLTISRNTSLPIKLGCKATCVLQKLYVAVGFTGDCRKEAVIYKKNCKF